MLERQIRQALNGSFWRVETVERTGSTNLDLIARARAGETEGAVLIADEQTSGRGRGEHRFFSPPGSGLYLSFLLDPARVFPYPVTLLAGVCAAQSIEALLPETSVQIKWVNDLYSCDKKICGILAQKAREYLVVGIGVNVFSPKGGFPEKIAPFAGALCEKESFPDLRALLAAELLNRIERALSSGIDALIDEVRRRDYLFGKRVFYQEEGLFATACGITDAGELLLELPDQTKRAISSGRVRLASKEE